MGVTLYKMGPALPTETTCGCRLAQSLTLKRQTGGPAPGGGTALGQLSWNGITDSVVNSTVLSEICCEGKID